MQADTSPCFINFRLPPDLFRRLDGAARAAGITRAELLRRQIERLDPSPNEGASQMLDRAA